jgi:replicative DNA helicase
MPDFGKVPPQAIDCEEAVLGAMMLEGDVASEIITLLKPEAFYKNSNRKIFEAIQFISHAGQPVDSITVTERLRATGGLEEVGGPVYLMGLTNKIVSAANTEYHSGIILQKYLQRELIRVSSEIQSKAYDDTYDIKDLLDFAENSIFHISQTNVKSDPVRLSKCIDDVLIEIGKIFYKEKELVGIPSGFTPIDRKTGGFQGSNLIIVAARPSMGKTALAQIIAKNMAIQKYPVGIFTLEMSNSELGIRYLSGESGYSNMRIKSADIDYDKLCMTANNIANLPIYLDETAGLSIYELRSKVKKLILKSGIKAVIIDYLQLMHGEGKSREQEVSFISRGLKGIAKEFSIPVIALSQLNREVETRNTKRPMLSDLRESGQIEQDADMVWFLYRPEVYGFKDFQIGNDNYDSSGLLLIDCAKHRNGPIFSIPLYHNESFSVIQDTKIEDKCTF